MAFLSEAVGRSPATPTVHSVADYLDAKPVRTLDEHLEAEDVERLMHRSVTLPEAIRRFQKRMSKYTTVPVGTIAKPVVEVRYLWLLLYPSFRSEPKREPPLVSRRGRQGSTRRASQRSSGDSRPMPERQSKSRHASRQTFPRPTRSSSWYALAHALAHLTL